MKSIVKFSIIAVFLVGTVAGLNAAAITGAIFTTDSTCSGVNLNIFESKGDVYLDGGPISPHAAGLPNGDYYIRVTEPDGALLGTTVGSAHETYAVTGGDLPCLHLSEILIRASNGQPGYDDTTNGGGEYKVWISTSSTFDNSTNKTDNFKVKADEVPQSATLVVKKFYDANANGIMDGTDVWIEGWQVTIQDDPHAWIDYVRYTTATLVLEPGAYSVAESHPIEQNWNATTTSPVSVTLANGDTAEVDFGNLCLGAGGGLTLGFWSNKNGAALFGSDDLALMVSLHLRNANGTDFDPSNYAAFRSWILSASATNMAYMLSAQLAAMELNVLNGKVNGNAIVYAPGAVTGTDYPTVNALMAAGDAALDANGYTVQAGPDRTLQEAIKTALDRANNNLNFVQSGPCAFSFAQ